MFRLRSKKTIIMFALVIGACFMAVGYSILMTELKINGSANITSTWDIRITNINCYSFQGGAYLIDEPTFTATTAKFKMAVVMPGDSYSCTITIKNQGTLTGVVNNIAVSSSGSDAVYYTYSGLKEGDIIASGATKYVYVNGAYASDNYVIPDSRVKTFSMELDWVQYTNQTIPPKTYTIAYNSNGGTGVMTPTTCIKGGACTFSTNQFTRSGYTFLGWALSPTGPIIGNGSDMEYFDNAVNAGETLILYAKWGVSTSYSYYGNYQTYTVSSDGSYQLEVWGAEGGYRSSNSYSGKGGYAKGTVYLRSGDVLYVYVGGNGTNHNGYNGGGLSGCTTATSCTANIYGGGASDIRINSTSLYARVIVAGGGGSVGAATKKGGYGGGWSGGSTTENYYGQGCSSNICGQGGTSTSGGKGTTTSGYTATAGSFGQGGQGYYLNNGRGGGGGGGWYGGSGSVPDGSADDDRGGGGGSGFVYYSGVTVPSGYLLGKEYIMTNYNLYAGSNSIPNPTGSGTTTGRSGDGYARITKLS